MNKSDLMQMRESITHGVWVSGGTCGMPTVTAVFGNPADLMGRRITENICITNGNSENRCENADAIAALPAILDRAIEMEEQLTALIKVINDSVKDTAFPHKLYEALIDGDTRKMKPISEIVELAKEIEDDSK